MFTDISEVMHERKSEQMWKYLMEYGMIRIYINYKERYDYENSGAFGFSLFSAVYA